jgi:AcrR family transcriptional regulator
MARHPRESRDRRVEATRQTLLDAALSIFSAHGYRGARMDDIAGSAGVAKGTVYNHFADKAAVLDAVLERWSARHAGCLVDAMADAVDPDAALGALFAANAGFVRDHLAAARLIGGIAAGHDEVLKARLNGWYQPVFAHLLAAVIGPGVAAGDYRPMEPQTTAVLVMSFLIATSSQTDDVGRPWIDPTQAADFVRHALRAERGGL